MRSPITTRRSFLSLSTSLAALLAGCGTQSAEVSEDDASQDTNVEAASVSREQISDDSDGGHAIEVSVDTATFAAVDVTKTGEAEGDEADFYGVNSAVYAEEGATLNLDDVTVTTNGTHANAVFSYGEGTTINVSRSTIETSGNCSGGVMVTGGGTLNATDLQVHTTGRSSASIRSDRGGGTQKVTGGTYVTEGTGSPVVYSTADVTVANATMTSTASQGVVVEGKNSVRLVDCELSASNTTKNSDKSEWFQAVMIYQSMSGDAAQGAAEFSMEGGSLTNGHGDVFFVNNTVATIGLKGASIANNDESGVFLRAAAAGWGNEGQNGGQVTVEADGQTIDGDMLVDEVSNLNLYLRNASAMVGAINPEGAAGEVYVELADGSTWELTSDAHIASLTCDADSITLAGHTLMVGDAAYVEGTASSGEAIQTVVYESTGGPGGEPPAGEPPTGGPGEHGSSGGPGGEPPAGEHGEQAGRN